MTPSYLQGSTAAVLVFDVTRPETVTTALGLGERVTESSPDVMLYLVGNKCDLSADVQLPDDLNLPVLLTSAKNGEGVESLFVDIARAAIGKTASS